ncbi:hypothetical protein V6N12_041876 [Hibiscus sabdariffa]|uniref:Uncharacterized protein n=1 Tax=Hibiscus sabdariffa TaxID=183260 RepID=A0ABR2ED49_9ROSI
MGNAASPIDEITKSCLYENTLELLGKGEVGLWLHLATSRWPGSAVQSCHASSGHMHSAEYYSWYLENGKPFLVSVEVGNKWREDPRCLKHRQLTSEFGQSFEEPTDEPNFEGWPSSWNSVEDPSIHVSDNPWEQPSFGYVSEQPPMYGGSSSSQPAYTDDGAPSMQVDDQWFNDEQTPDPPRRIVHP